MRCVCGVEDFFRELHLKITLKEVEDLGIICHNKVLNIKLRFATKSTHNSDSEYHRKNIELIKGHLKSLPNFNRQSLIKFNNYKYFMIPYVHPCTKIGIVVNDECISTGSAVTKKGTLNMKKSVENVRENEHVIRTLRTSIF